MCPVMWSTKKEGLPVCCVALTLLLNCVLGNTGDNCPTPYLSHHHGDKTVCCLPAFNCGPDAQIRHCTEDYGQDECEPCSSGEINPVIVSSVDKVEHRCFKKENYHESCPLEDTIPAATLSNSKACLLHCTCAHDSCYYGNEPCSCDGPRQPCQENETMDPVTGDCVPCPKNSYKLKPGCGPCTWNVTAFLGDLVKKNPTETKTVPMKPSTSVPVIIASGPAYIINGTDGEEKDKHKDDGKEVDGFSAAPVIVIVALVVVASILVAVILVAYRKSKSNDDHSKLVQCYHALCPGRRLEAQAGQRDTESVTDPPYHPVAAQNQGKPLQHVPPITRVNGAATSPNGAYNDSSIPFADLSMSPERSVCQPSLEEINEEEEQEPSSVSPLIENSENTNSVDPDLTEQKTAASGKASL